MNILFVYSENFHEENGSFYSSSGSFPSSIWENYLLNDSDHIYIYGCRTSSKSSTISSTTHTHFILTDHYQSPLDFFIKKRKIKGELIELIKNIDAVVIRLPSLMGIIAAEVCIEYKKPYAVEVVGNVFKSLWHHSNILGKPLAPIAHYLNKKHIKKAPMALYVTKEYLQKCYPTMGSSDYASDVQINNHDTSVIEEREEKIEQRSKKKLILGTIGNTGIKYKGQHDVFKAISELNKEGYTIKYKMVGGGDEKHLRKLARSLGIENQISFLGVLNRSQIFQFLKELDLYLQPSYLEGLPRSVVEAMSCGVPILASDVGGIPELIPNEFLHKPGDYLKIKNDLIRVATNSKTLHSMAKTNWENSKNYDYKLLMDKRRAFYQKLYDRVI